MKNLKYLKYVLSLSLLICVGYFYAMKRGHDEMSSSSSFSSSSAVVASPVDVYFVPKDQVGQQLISFLEQANNQILVAVYWVTDQSIIDKLIDKKKRGIDVQIIIDESTYTTFRYVDPFAHMNQFLDRYIDFMVYPSQHFKEKMSERIGSMHDKFVVIDNAHVFTGSANFTQAGLGGAQGDSNNYENVVVMHSAIIAQGYAREFQVIKNKVFDLYITTIARTEWGNIAAGLQNLLQKSSRMNLLQARNDMWDQFNQIGRDGIQRFFELLHSQRRLLTQSQRDLLISNKLPESVIQEVEKQASEMSLEDADAFVERVIRGHQFLQTP